MNELVTFEYLGVVDEQFAAYPEHYELLQEVRSKLTINFPYDYTSRKVGCELVVDFNLLERPDYLRCGITCVFQFSKDSWRERRANDEDAIDLEEHMFVHFAAFTAGTLRGVLHARQQASSVNAILPPINVFDLLGTKGEGTRRLWPAPSQPTD